jgi:CheY-like chemotaxis protein/DNA-binding XRE family transcriptional regulator
LDLEHRLLARRLRLARKLAGWSQADAARILGVTHQQYQKYESSKNRLSAVGLQRLAAALQVDLDWFHQETAPRENRPDADRLAIRMLTLFNSLANRADQEMLLDLAAHMAVRQGTATSSLEEVTQGTGGWHVTGTRRILLVDDDPDVLCITGAGLQRSGFEVITACSGDDALRLLSTGEDFGVLVTDYLMPGLTGIQLIELAREHAPGLPALVITGYGCTTATQALPDRVHILAKPFTRSEFMACVERLFDSDRLYAPSPGSTNQF